MIGGMGNATAAGLLALILATHAVPTARCSSSQPNPNPGPAPSPSPSPAPSGEVYVTSDGVRFRVETVASSLVIPWAMQFAPDGRLFVTERPGRVRIVDVANGSSQIALTFGDVGSTKMACPDVMDVENSFLPALQRVAKWRISGQQLDLLDSGGARVARFDAKRSS